MTVRKTCPVPSGVVTSPFARASGSTVREPLTVVFPNSEPFSSKKASYLFAALFLTAKEALSMRVDSYSPPAPMDSTPFAKVMPSVMISF